MRSCSLLLAILLFLPSPCRSQTLGTTCQNRASDSVRFTTNGRSQGHGSTGTFPIIVSTSNPGDQIFGEWQLLCQEIGLTAPFTLSRGYCNGTYNVWANYACAGDSTPGSPPGNHWPGLTADGISLSPVSPGACGGGVFGVQFVSTDLDITQDCIRWVVMLRSDQPGAPNAGGFSQYDIMGPNRIDQQTGMRWVICNGNAWENPNVNDNPQPAAGVYQNWNTWTSSDPPLITNENVANTCQATHDNVAVLVAMPFGMQNSQVLGNGLPWAGYGISVYVAVTWYVDDFNTPSSTPTNNLVIAANAVCFVLGID